jgi:hypothetical protein
LPRVHGRGYWIGLQSSVVLFAHQIHNQVDFGYYNTTEGYGEQ